MAVTNEPVEIRVRIVDENSDAAISGVEQHLNRMGAAGASSGAKVSAAMNGMAGSARGTASGFHKLAEASMELNYVQGRNREILAALRKGEVSASQATLDLAESMQEQTAAAAALAAAKAELIQQDAKLSSRESYGVARIGASALTGSFSGMGMGLAQVISQNEKLAGLWNAALPLAMAAGMVGILVDMGHEVYNVYEKYISLDAAAKKYEEEVRKTTLQDFGNTHSIETTILRIQDAKDAIAEYRSEAQKLHAMSIGQTLGAFASAGAAFGGASGIAGLAVSRQMSDSSFDMQRQLDKLRKEQLPAQQHQLTLLGIEATHSDAKLRGEQKITAEYGKQNALIRENSEYRHQEDAKYGNPVDPKVIDDEARLQNQIALNNEQNQLYELRRTQAIELRHLQQAADQSRLRGSALYKAQEEAAIENLKDKDIDSVAARNAIHEKFHNEEMRRLEDEKEAVAKRAREADSAGLTGLAKIEAQGKDRDQDILNKAKNGGYVSLYDAQADRISNQRQTLAEMQTAQQAFTEKINALADESARHQISGFARIAAEEKKQLDGLKIQFDKTYGQLDHASPEYQKGLAQLHRGQGLIHGDADQQTADLARKNAEETAQIEAEAHARWMSAEQGKTAAIEAQYEERRRKLQEELDANLIQWKDYEARVNAAEEERDAEMVQAAKQAREKMAREFEGLFRGLDHPLQELQRLGEKAAGEAAAAMVQKYQQRHGAAAGSTTELAGLGGLFGGIFGHGHPGGPGRAGTESLGRTKTESAVFTVAAAQIHVGAASFAPSGSTTESFLGGVGLPSSGGATGISTANAGGIGFAPSSSRVFGGGTSFASFPSATTFSGGAGSAGMPEAAARTTGGAAAAPKAGGGVFNDLQQGMSLFSQSKSTFGNKSGDSNGTGLLQTTDKDVGNGTLNADGTYTSDSKGGGMLNGGGLKSNAMGAVGGALGMYGAFEGNGGVGGALGGAMSGMQLGMALGGPVGAAVGAAAGAIVGAIGFGGREKARVYDLKQVRPRIQSDQLAYNTGSMDYMAAYSDMQALDEEAKKTTRAMGMTGKSYYVDSIRPEIRAAIQKFNNEEKAGRSQYTASAAQYDIGTDFVPRTGMAVIHQGERIMPSDQNERITRAMEGGGTMPVESSGEMHVHIHAIDTRSAVQFIMDNKHTVRNAMNASYSENSGGSDFA